MGTTAVVRALGLVALFAISAPSFAQTKIPVKVFHSGEDNVGKSYAFYLKEELRRSASFTLLEDLSPNPHITVSVVSIDHAAGNSSSIAIALAYDSFNAPVNGIYITSLVQSCGRDVTQKCAADLLPSIDNAVTYLQKKGFRYWASLYTANDDWLLKSRDSSPKPAAQPSSKGAAKPRPDNPF